MSNESAEAEQAPPQQPMSGWPSPASPELIVHRQAKPKAEGTTQKYNLTFFEAIEDLYDSQPDSYFQPDPESAARGEIMLNKFMRQCQRREDRIAAGTATPQDLEDARRELFEHIQANAAVMEEMQERKKKEEHLSQFYADLERQVRAEEGLPPVEREEDRRNQAAAEARALPRPESAVVTQADNDPQADKPEPDGKTRVSCAQIAEILGLGKNSYGAIQQRLKRFRKQHGEGWVETNELAKNKPMFLYEWGKVKSSVQGVLSVPSASHSQE